MDNQNLVAARLGLPFVCSMCREVHEKADLNLEEVHNCYAKVWYYALDYSSDSYSGGIPRPTWQLTRLWYFNTHTIQHQYPIENDVFMLALPIWDCVSKLKKKLRDWEDDCLKHDIRFVEENGKLNDVRIIRKQLVINGCENEHFTYSLALLMMKREDIAKELIRIYPHPILDVEWKSLKESAKLLVQRWHYGQRSTFLFSEGTGVAQVPDEINSIREAEDFLRKSSLQNDQ
jgi:hypothetical protein